MKVSELMLFQDLVFRQGLNMTCRKGPKWGFLIPGDRVDVAATDRPEEIVGEMMVHTIFNGPFWLLPEELIKRGHLPQCRDKAVLFQKMRHVYGEFEQLSKVVAITFEPLWEIRGKDA